MTRAGTTSAPGEALASVEEVAASIAAAVTVLQATVLPLPQAVGRVLAEAVRAPMPLPRFDNAAMDGYAVRTADVAGANLDASTTLRLVAPSSAGQATPPELPAGCACPISTGAPLPAGYPPTRRSPTPAASSTSRVTSCSTARAWRGCPPTMRST